MYLSFSIFYRLRFICALAVFALALLYLAGGEKIALIGFAVITFVGAVICSRVRKGTMPAVCDLCKSSATMKAEYGAGFSNARLIINCPHCGRVVNKAEEGVNPAKE